MTNGTCSCFLCSCCWFLCTRCATCWEGGGGCPDTEYLRILRAAPFSYSGLSTLTKEKECCAENIDGRHRSHPIVLQLPSRCSYSLRVVRMPPFWCEAERPPVRGSVGGSLKDVRSWLSSYGEPDPGKIPTGSMTTFAPSRRRFGKEKSRSSQMSCKVRPPPIPRSYSQVPVMPINVLGNPVRQPPLFPSLALRPDCLLTSF